MKRIPIEIPPGIVTPLSLQGSKGRWLQGLLMRWVNGRPRPVGGWRTLTGAAAATIGGPVRGMHLWRRNSGAVHVAIGTPSKLFGFSDGTLTDLTPAGHTVGAADASGTYYNRAEATTWQLDNYGENLVAVSLADGDILYCTTPSTAASANALSGVNTPTNCTGVVVTPERFLVALGADGVRRKLKWCDQEADPATDANWQATNTNQAGDIELTGAGQILAGRAAKNETLLWTEEALYAMRYIGGPLVYSFPRVGEKCGAISRHAMAVVGDRAFWMGSQGWYEYNGYVKPLPSDVHDYVFEDLTRAQASKITCVVNSEMSEVTWFVPFATTEISRYVTYNYQEGWWSTGTMRRTSGIDRGPLQYPLLAGVDGQIYEHEIEGGSYSDNFDSFSPYVQSGPIALGEGDQVMTVLRYYPDDPNALAYGAYDHDTTIRGLMELNEFPTEQTFGPFGNSSPTDVRFTARYIRISHGIGTGARAGNTMRVGIPHLEVVPGGRR